MVNATQGFLVPVFSANVHEARGYNRLAKVREGGGAQGSHRVRVHH